MNIQFYPTAGDFLSHAGRQLAQDEARYGLILGLAKMLVENPYRYGPTVPWFCTASAATGLCAVAMRTSPFKVLLAYISGEPAVVARHLVTSISKKEAVIPGMVGDKELTDRFMELWCRKQGVTVEKTMAERLYRLVRVNDVPEVKGWFRPAMEADKELVARWTHAFNVDTFGTSLNLPETDITPRIAKGEVFLWEDGGPVSMAVKLRPTEHGMAVGYVYTPPELRHQGYATSCVAELCRHILQSGCRFCTLYADLANAVSNSIYKKIGFEEVSDYVDYTFAVT